MLKSYHPGVYGSKSTETWSCCDKIGYQASGCTDANKADIIYSTFNSVTSEDTLVSDTATGSSIRDSSSCDSLYSS